MQRRFTGITLLAPVVLAGLLLLIFDRTDPVAIGPAGVLGVFVLIYLLSFSLLFVLLHFVIPLVSRVVTRKKESLHQREVKIGVKKAYYIASLIAFVPVLLLAMRSFAQLKLGDVAHVVAFVGVVSFYILKRK